MRMSKSRYALVWQSRPFCPWGERVGSARLGMHILSRVFLYVIIYTQDYHLKIPHSQSIYQLRSVIVFDKLSGGTNHYRAFFRSLKDPTQWFHANDSIVSPLHSIVGPVSMYLSQVTPVSIATVLQQHPCQLFYELVEGVY